KSVLMLQKPPTRQPPQWGPNFIAAAKNGYDKSLHQWQQNQKVFEKLIERFTVRGNLVADPFAGSGTTLRAARALDRLAWGADIDACVEDKQGAWGTPVTRCALATGRGEI